MLGIIGPMPEEIAYYAVGLPGLREVADAHLSVREGEWNGRPVVLLQCGVGKVNAAAATEYLIQRYPVESVVLQGVAGSMNPALTRGDIVLADNHIQHDLDATPIGFLRGQVPFTDLRDFASDPALLRTVRDHCVRIGQRHVVGTILSGDRFIADAGEVLNLHREFGAQAIDMEGAAAAQVCALHRMPFLSVRAISDAADGDAPEDFMAFVKTASRQLFTVLEGLMAPVRDPALTS